MYRQQPPSTQQTATSSPGSFQKPNASAATKAARKAPYTGPIENCLGCGRPCSGPAAIQAHLARGICNKPASIANYGKDICPHCDCRFGSPNGLEYHVKNFVCGAYENERLREVIEACSVYLAGRPHVSPPPTTPAPRHPVPPSQPMNSAPSSQGPNVGGDVDRYGHLSEVARQTFESEIRQAEVKYGALLRKAKAELPPGEAEQQIARYMNSFNTKASTTRKKYGIRINGFRPQEELIGERARLWDVPPEEISATPNLQPWGSATKRARRDTRGSSVPTASQQIEQPPEEETPRKRVPLSEMGGLGASSATAEQVDPTAHLEPLSQARPVSNGSHSSPMPAPHTGSATPGVPVGAPVGAAVPSSSSHGASIDDPMALDSATDSDDDEDDEDGIPARAPSAPVAVAAAAAAAPASAASPTTLTADGMKEDTDGKTDKE